MGYLSMVRKELENGSKWRSKSGATGKAKIGYILAASHSGSTLLARILSINPSICSVGELKLSAMGDVSSYVCSCGEKIQSCDFWRDIEREIRHGGAPFSLAKPNTDIRSINSNYAKWLLRPMHRGLVLEHIRDAGLYLSKKWRSHLESVQHMNRLLVGALLTKTRSSVVIDSSKVGLRLKYLLKNPDLDVYVIRLVRDGRAVALTYHAPDEYADARNRSLRRGGRGIGGPSHALGLEAAAKEWCLANKEAEAICASLPGDRIFSVKYEELCKNPAYIARQIAVFLGALETIGFSGATIPDVESHIVGNGMRFDRSVKVVTDERWKEAYSADQLSVVENIVGEMNRQHGYL